jgi:hypothetical protein
LTQLVDGIQFTVTLDPNPPQSGNNTTVRVTIRDAADKPIPNGRLVASFTAASMSMSPVIAAAESKGDGTYTAVLKPTGMAGAHTFTLRVDLDLAGKAYQAQFKNLAAK